MPRRSSGSVRAFLFRTRVRAFIPDCPCECGFAPSMLVNLTRPNLLARSFFFCYRRISSKHPIIVLEITFSDASIRFAVRKRTVMLFVRNRRANLGTKHVRLISMITTWPVESPACYMCRRPEPNTSVLPKRKTFRVLDFHHL